MTPKEPNLLLKAVVLVAGLCAIAIYHGALILCYLAAGRGSEEDGYAG